MLRFSMVKARSVIIMMMFFTLISCGKNDKSEKSESDKLITVTSSSLSSSLFYSGSVQPLKTIVVTSPAEGVIDDMAFHYGDPVKPNQLLFIISSEKFKTDYKNALMQYIKAKNEFSNARSQLTESQFLHKNQLISEDDYKSKQSGFYNSQLSLIQSQDALTIMLKQLAVPGVRLEQLNIENIGKITQAMNLQGGSQKLRAIAPAAGVALLATKASGSDEVKKLEKGDLVKQGDVLAVIGDVSGLVIHISVSEFNINQLKVGQKVQVTGAAFPGIVLQGQITGLDHQGQTSTGGLPNFPVEVVVPKLTVAEQAVIHMGMSAKVEVNIEQPKQITVPINAIVQKQGATFVRRKDASSGKIQLVQVKTGETTMDSVVIESNLKEGDKILVSG
jgi:HlyD family secretion protein